MKIKQLVLALFIALFCSGAITNHYPWDGTVWVVTSPNDEALLGNAYKEIYDLRKGVALRMNREHVDLATDSVGGEHVQGSARAWFQDAAPGLQPDGTALAAGDTGMLWFDTNATPDNLAYVLTATTPTWTLLSTSITGETLTWTPLQTFTAGILSNDDITLGAGDDLVGAADSVINMNAFDVTAAGAVTAVSVDIGSTIVVVGTLDDDSMATADDTTLATSESITAYVDASVGGDDPTPNDSTPAAMEKAHAYLTQTSGFVTAYAALNTGDPMIGYVDTDDNPAAGGVVVARTELSDGDGTDQPFFSFFVGSGKYFEITLDTVAVTIHWTPLVTGGAAPIDQD